MSYSEIFVSHFNTTYYQVSGIFTIYIAATLLALAIEFTVVSKGRSTVYKLIKGEVSKYMRQDIWIWILEITNIWSFVGKVITLGVTFYIANILNQWFQNISIFRITCRKRKI